MTIYFVLLAFKDNLFAQNHENSSLICLFVSVNSWAKSEMDIYKVVSSAKDTIFPSHDLYIYIIDIYEV